MLDKHTLNSIEWILNDGRMAKDIEITDDVSEISVTKMDWPITQNPKVETIAASARAAAKSKIAPYKPHSFVVNENKSIKNNGIVVLCWFSKEESYNE